MDKEIQFVYSEDFVFIYIDGVCVYENHASDLEPEWLLRELGFKPKVSGIEDEFFRADGVYLRYGTKQDKLDDIREDFNQYLAWGDVI